MSETSKNKRWLKTIFPLYAQCAPCLRRLWMAVPMGWLVNYLISFFQYRTGKWAKLHKASSQ